MNAQPQYDDFVRKAPVATTSSSARYIQSSEDYVSEFYRHFRTLVRNNELSSNPMTYVRHPSFGRIVDMGDKVVPLIIASLEVAPTPIMLALPSLTGVNMATPDVQGRPAEIASKWIQWFNQRGNF